MNWMTRVTWITEIRKVRLPLSTGDYDDRGHWDDWNDRDS